MSIIAVKAIAMIALSVGPFVAGVVAPAVIVDQWFRHVAPRPRTPECFMIVAVFTVSELSVGLRLGLEQHAERLRDQLKMIVVVKLVKSFVMGMALAWCNRSRRGRFVAVACVAVFATITPLGIVAGTRLEHSLLHGDAVYESSEPVVLALQVVCAFALCRVLLSDLGPARRRRARRRAR